MGECDDGTQCITGMGAHHVVWHTGEVMGEIMGPVIKGAGAGITDQDFEIQLREVAPGLYQEQLSMPLPGRWYLVLHVRKGDDLHETRGWTNIEQARVQG